ncbi:MAG: hypothetical protein CSA76_03735 [Spirochaetales bacterium]|nr:MAG: hypothetical protein CSA76_03735 [Spirochaetales bacterium]
MAEQRTEYRKLGYAKVLLNNLPGYLRNLTGEGCKVVTFSPLPQKQNETVSMKILPDETSGLDPVSLTAELCWELTEGPYYEYGFHIASFDTPPGREIYRKLVGLYGRS